MEYRRAQALLGLRFLYGRDRDRFYYEESAAIHRGLAQAYLDLGDPYAAAVEAEHGVDVAASDAVLWTALGMARYRLADLDAAEAALSRAVELAPDLPEAHRGLGLVAMARNRPGRARTHAERAFRSAPRPVYALDMARWAVAEGDYGAAAAALGVYLRSAAEGPAVESAERLRAFYEEVSRAPVGLVDSPVTRAQVRFDLVPGDEVPLVPVGFNGRPPAYVMLDTGAERNVIDRDFARSSGVDTIWPGEPLRGALGISPGGHAIVDRMEIGTFAIERVPFAVADFAALHLGGRGPYYIAAVINPALLFRDYTVVLDYRYRRFELHRAAPGAPGYAERPTRQRKTAVPFVLDANGVWPVVAASLDGSREIPLLVDTGASEILLDRGTAGALRLDPRALSVQAGGHIVHGLRALLLDESPAEPHGIDLHGVLGFPFFRDKRLALDYPETILVIED